MRMKKVLFTGITLLCLAVFGCGTADDQSQTEAVPQTGAVLKTEAVPETETAPQADAIIAAAEVDSGHPEIEPGLSCNDCHEIKLDAKTTATQVYLFGQSPGHDEGEGVYPKERIWEEIEKAIGGLKHDPKTFILATSLNNVPLSTTCEWTLEPKTKSSMAFMKPARRNCAISRQIPM